MLEILGRRPDGYHELRTVLQLIDYKDRLTLEAISRPEIQLQTAGRKTAQGSENLVYQAADLLRTRLGLQVGARILLQKKIPAGAGLGGGSSDAALTLLGLNQLWHCRMPRADLLSLAAELGSDVPFFLVGGTVLAWGRGEQMSPLDCDVSPAALIVVYPELEISTAQAYAATDWGVCPAHLLTNPDLDNTIRRFREIVGQGEPGWERLVNDFEGPAFDRYPVLREIRQELLRAGCRRVLLCGSGSALAGLAPIGEAAGIERKVSQRGLGTVSLCRTLSRFEYEEVLREHGLQLV